MPRSPQKPATRIEKELDYERYLLRMLLDTVSDRIYFKDTSGRYLRISQAVAQQYGLATEQVIGKTDFDFFAIGYAQEVQAEEQKILQSGKPVFNHIEREIWCDGRPDTWAIKSRIPLRDADGRIVGSLGISRDITETKKVEEIDKLHVQRLTLVADVARAVTSSLEIKNLLRVMVELVKEGFAYYGVNVWLVTEPGDAVQLKAGFHPQGDDLGQAGVQIPIKQQNDITRVCRTGELVLNNILNGGKNLPLAEIFPETRSLLVLPLKVAEKIIGVLDIRSQHPNTFREDAVMLLRSLADQATIAIRNASLYQSEQTRRHFAERLYQISRNLSSTIKFSELLDLILQQLDQIVRSDRSILMFVDHDRLQIVAVRGFPREFEFSDMQISIRENDIYQQIYRDQQPVSISDLTLRSDWQPQPDVPGIHSWLGMPLILYNEVIGILSMMREEISPFTLNEQTLVQAFAGQCSLALENARLYENTARFNQQLEQRVQQRTEELRQAYAQLERLDVTKSNFIAVTSHELRTPLTVLHGYSQMLLQHPVIQNEAGLTPLVTGIHHGTERLHEIVNSMLDIAKIDSKALQLSPQPLSLAFLIRIVTNSYESDFRQRNFSLVLQDLEELPPIEADSEALQKVFSQLISNAMKYTPDGGQITISGRVLEVDDQELPYGGVEIIVNDNGIGIDPSLHELIFTKFFQTGEVSLHSTGKTKFRGGGPGLGLPIARGIVEAHHGRLWVESPGHDEIKRPGTQFHVILPTRQPVN